MENETRNFVASILMTFVIIILVIMGMTLWIIEPFIIIVIGIGVMVLSVFCLFVFVFFVMLNEGMF